MAHATRIMVTNFDAVRQADIWLTRGAEAATELLVGMLRTAILLGSELVIDRNQLLDGVFFLALGPERIARQLGLEDDALLPITVNCSQDQWDEASDLDVKRLRGRVPAESEPVSLQRQLEDVRAPYFLTASSALIAITATSHGDNPWLAPEPGPDWFPGCGFVDIMHPLEPGDRTSAHELICAAQQAWITAAQQGRIQLDFWGGNMTMEPALQLQKRNLIEACGTDLTPAPLAQHVLTVTSRVRKDAVAALTAWQAGHPGTTDKELRLALSLWSRAYYQAIAWKDDTMLVAFNDEGVGTGVHRAPKSDNFTSDKPEADNPDFALARRYGLAMLPRPAWRRFLDRRTGPVKTDRPMRVEGEILDHLRIIDAGSYRQLARSSERVVASLVENRDPEAMYDLALACRRVVDTGPSHSRTRWITRVRVVVMSLIAMAIAALTMLGEFADLTGFQQVVVVVSAAVIGALASLPWDDIVAQFQLRPSAMTAMINLSENP